MSGNNDYGMHFALLPVTPLPVDPSNPKEVEAARGVVGRMVHRALAMEVGVPAV